MDELQSTKNEEIQAFFDMEEQYSLFDIRIRGLPIWVRLRHKTYKEIFKKKGKRSKAHTTAGNDYRSHLRALKLWGRNLVYRNPFFADSTEKIYYGHPRRKKLEDGLWWDIYCDPIHEHEDPEEYVHVEYPQVREHRTPAKTENLRYTDFIFYTGGIAERIPGLSVTLSTDEHRKVERIETAVKDTFDIELDLRPVVEEKLTHHRYKEPLYRLMLKRVDPDIAVVVVNYGRMTFIRACKQLDIPVVELQHGGFGPDHMGFSYPGDRENPLFPDYLFVFGEFWKEFVEFPIPDENVFPVGYPHLERQRKRYENHDPQNSVLFISQGPFGTRLTKFAVEYAKIDNERDVVVKLHPGEYDRWEEEYPWLKDTQVTVIDSDDPPLYKLLADASIQVGVNSTVIYEGLCFGLDTYLINIDTYRLRHLVQKGAAKLIESPEELKNEITESDTGPTFDKSHYFKPNPIENINNSFDEIRQRENL